MCVTRVYVAGMWVTGLCMCATRVYVAGMCVTGVCVTGLCMCVTGVCVRVKQACELSRVVSVLNHLLNSRVGRVHLPWGGGGTGQSGLHRAEPWVVGPRPSSRTGGRGQGARR